MSIAIYLAGSIKKSHEKSEESYWTEGDIALLREQLDGWDVIFLNPAIRSDDLSDQRSVFGRDMTQVSSSDCVFVDARDRRGLGVGAEMMWAKVNQIPVITWAPKNSHYYKDEVVILDVVVENFIHPFVNALSDKVVENLIDGAEWIEKIMDNQLAIKGIESIEGAMEYYKEHQLHRDQPMQEVFEKLKVRLQR